LISFSVTLVSWEALSNFISYAIKVVLNVPFKKVDAFGIHLKTPVI
jgi:hypothetical protein